MARFEIKVEGFNKRGASTGKAVRVLQQATSKSFIMDNIAQVKGSIKVGQCGRHVVELSDDARKLRRVDEGRRGTIPATVGMFKEVVASA